MCPIDWVSDPPSSFSELMLPILFPQELVPVGFDGESCFSKLTHSQGNQIHQSTCYCPSLLHYSKI
ncbi:hypothetical protein RchiOBHm_Chr7g0225031 [Rosa chinensis]|uniref:Uncharacterized protein n=1 Tax=Rosa chinensis TaxID=74649 RepID=A0A2P6PDZ4_ROSCH|nr:hypothetical protein RchiOBHm_Chr7g0225031 [Rosa chinensis]